MLTDDDKLSDLRRRLAAKLRERDATQNQYSRRVCEVEAQELRSELEECMKKRRVSRTHEVRR